MKLPDGGASRCVLIGTSQYSDERIPPLPEVAATVQALQAMLTDEDYGIIPAKNCAVLEDEGDLRRVGSVLRTAARDAQDLLLIYFAGHGLVSGTRHDLYLALRDSELTDPEFSALEYDKLRAAVLNSPARTKVIILDCCFAGRAISRSMADTEAVFSQQTEVGGTYVLTAAPRDKVALILPDEPYTAFTGRLLQLLSDGVPEASELLSIDDLYRQLYRVMKAEGLPLPQKHGTLNADELALSRNRAYAAVAGPKLRERSETAWTNACGGLTPWADALTELRDVHTRQERILGAEHLDTMHTLCLIGLCESAAGDADQGTNTLDGLLRTQMRLFGPDDPETLSTRQCLAAALGEKGEHGAAVDMLRVLLPDRRRVLGPDDALVLRTAHLLARNLVALGEFTEAEALLREVVTARERLFGADDPHTQRAARDLQVLTDSGLPNLPNQTRTG
ncbi:MAG TPA: tetratricopeptide repeat protein [Actinospica sp.]|nr:tetratricopeptide repeat protein [Actinospica sp.]